MFIKAKILAKDYHSTIHKSLITESDDVKVLDKVPLPELHLMEGITNHLFYGKGGLIDILSREKAMEWAIHTNVVSVGYHGEKFEGPECRKLLKSSDHLLSSGFLELVDNPLAVVPIATTFQAFNKLVQSCFGSDNVEDDVLHLLDKFI